MNISTQNNATYTLDKLSGQAYGIIASNNSSGLDCRNANNITGFNITASTPSGTDIRFAFSDGGSWSKLNTSGQFVAFSSSIPDFAAMSTSGNTIAQLQALKSIPAFAGKLIRVCVALSSTDAINSKPTVKLSVNASSSSNQTSLIQLSPIYELSDNAMLSSIMAEKSSAGGGSVDLYAKLFRADGSESDWLTPEQAKGAEGNAVQFRASYYAPNIGSSSATLSKITAQYSSNKDSGVRSSGRMFSVTQDWYIPIRTCRLNIRHSQLGASSMKVYAAFRASPSHAVNEQLGVSGANRQTYQLKHPNGVRYDTFRLFFDGQEIFSGFDLNCEVGRLTCTAPSGTIITCSYEYGWDKEQWRELSLTSRNSIDEYDMSEYRLTIDSNTASVAAFRIDIQTPTGSTNNELVGTATGTAMTYQLQHYASTISSVRANNLTLPASSYLLMDNSKLLRVAAGAGAKIYVSYNWTADPVQIFQVTAAFSK